MRGSLLLAAILIAQLNATAVHAQPSPLPKRPKLDKGLDVNDWRSYYRCGLYTESSKRAHECFYWASRLDPSLAEPYYANWLVSGAKNDSLLEMALYRDPFIHDSRVVKVAEPRPGIFTTAKAKGWNALRAGNYFRASVELAKAIKLDSTAIDEHWGLAISYYYRERFDSAAMALQPLMRVLRARQEKSAERAYKSLDVLEYMAAVAWRAAGRPDSARAALSRALSENLAHYRAHAMLGELARVEGDTATADNEWTLAIDLGPNDLAFRVEYARYQVAMGRAARAEQELRRVVDANPDYVDAHYYLATALDKQGRIPEAIAEYNRFLAIAPVGQVESLALVRTRIEKLTQ